MPTIVADAADMQGRFCGNQLGHRRRLDERPAQAVTRGDAAMPDNAAGAPYCTIKAYSAMPASATIMAQPVMNTLRRSGT